MHIFFVRFEADIDNIVPIVYKLAQQNNSAVMVVSLRCNYDIKNDYRLKYLKEQLNVKISHIHQLYCGFPLKYIYSKTIKYLLPEKYILSSNFFNIFNEKWACSLFQKYDVTSITFDYGAYSKYCSSSLINAAKKMNIPIINAPHGVRTCYTTKQNHEKGGYYDFSRSDYNLADHLLGIENTTDDKRIKVLGSARYCREWQNLNDILLKSNFSDTALPKPRENLKVLIFGKHRGREPETSQNFFIDHPTVKRIKGLDFVTVIFKGRPRWKAKHEQGNYSDYQSTRLIQWADVVVSSRSSLIFDMYFYNKPFLYVKYIEPDLKTTTEDYNAYWKINNEDELITILKKFYNGEVNCPYNKKDISDYIKDVIYAGDLSNDILTNYADFYSMLYICKES